MSPLIILSDKYDVFLPNWLGFDCKSYYRLRLRSLLPEMCVYVNLTDKLLCKI